mmetsp:Transcript_28899/g.69043  ORF Transcript_28899/g.69043 Transcript_28899/m.69043 type:complete len:225 (-) Transcript_28899:1128-1802(-)
MGTREAGGAAAAASGPGERGVCREVGEWTGARPGKTVRKRGRGPSSARGRGLLLSTQRFLQAAVPDRRSGMVHRPTREMPEAGVGRWGRQKGEEGCLRRGGGGARPSTHPHSGHASVPKVSSVGWSRHRSLDSSRMHMSSICSFWWRRQQDTSGASGAPVLGSGLPASQWRNRSSCTKRSHSCPTARALANTRLWSARRARSDPGGAERSTESPRLAPADAPLS